MGPDDAGRAIAGLIGHTPSPGIYSRLERAVQGMPAKIRVQELPGLLKRYKGGVPGWELRAVDLESIINGRPIVSREELLDAVRERSPVHTHRELVLTESPPRIERRTRPSGPAYQESASLIGEGIAHGEPRYKPYGHGGKDYTEILLLQPGLDFNQPHWDVPSTAAHARFDTHGDALRINELQSDLGIHNRKARELAVGSVSREIPFLLEDAWADLLIKRLAMEAARRGHRAIEVASPRAIADKVGGSIDNYEHFYGKVVPGALERLGRKMGGLVDETPAPPPQPVRGYEAAMEAMQGYDGVIRLALEAKRKLDAKSPPGARPAFGLGLPLLQWNNLAGAYVDDPGRVAPIAHDLYNALSADLARGGGDAPAAAAQMMPDLVRLAENYAAELQAFGRLAELADAQGWDGLSVTMSPDRPRRYIMSDEMRKRIIRDGIGASVLLPLMDREDNE